MRVAFLCALLGGSCAQAQFVEDVVRVIYSVGGGEDSEQFSLAPAAIGDLNGDGISEIVCTAPGRVISVAVSGAGYLLDGATGGVIREHLSPGAGVVFQKAAAAGDVNADGSVDYAIGGWGPGFAGTVLVYSGADGSVLWTFTGLTSNDQFGLGLSGIGDVNGDGHADLAVGAPFHREATTVGRVVVYSGADGTELWSRVGTVAHEALGQSCFSIEDADGDGARDLAVGSPQMRPTFQNTGPGFVTLLSGGDGAPIGDSIVSPSATSVDFGAWIPSPEVDVNGDGISEIIIADQFDAALGAQTGRAFVYDGATRGLLYTLTGSSALQGLGATCNAGDLDGDGLDDLIVTSWRSPDGAPGITGKLEAVRGVDGAPIGRVTSTSPGGSFGGWVFAMGDLDADGVPDFFTNAPMYSDDGPQRGRLWVMSGTSLVRCAIADLEAPFGSLDFGDVIAFLTAFGTGSVDADLAEPIGTLDFADVIAFLTSFGGGCHSEGSPGNTHRDWLDRRAGSVILGPRPRAGDSPPLRREPCNAVDL